MNIDKHYHAALSSEQLINESQIAKCIHNIKSLVSLPEQHFDIFYLNPLKNFLSYMQYYNQEAIKLRLEMIITALKIRRSCILPTGVSSENINKVKDVWTYTVFISVMMYKANILIDKDIVYKPSSIASIKKCILSKPVLTVHQYKSIGLLAVPNYLNPVLLSYIIDQNCIAWLSQYNDALNTVLKLISNTSEPTQIDKIIEQCFHNNEKYSDTNQETKLTKCEHQSEHTDKNHSSKKPSLNNVVSDFIDWLHKNKNNPNDETLNNIKIETSSGIAFLMPDVFQAYTKLHTLDQDIQHQLQSNEKIEKFVKLITLPHIGKVKVILP